MVSKYDECERKDLHVCNRSNFSTQRHCVQLILTLPPSVDSLHEKPPRSIKVLLIGGLLFQKKYLVAGDSEGVLSVWTVPLFREKEDRGREKQRKEKEEYYGLNYQPRKSFAAHSSSINAIESTSLYLLTACSEGYLNIFSWRDEEERLFLQRVRSVHLMTWSGNLLHHEPSIVRRITCLHRSYGGIRRQKDAQEKVKKEEKEEEKEGGYLLLGTSYGEVFTLPLGSYL